jgi:WD40 repeat protein
MHAYVLQDGAREGRFSADAGGPPAGAPDGSAKAASDDDEGCPCATSSNCVTAISFDKNQRRLVMGTNSGAVTVWNFNNGSLLRRCGHSTAFE